MKILAITTSSSNCSVAILEDNKLIKELNINNTKTHSETLMPLIKQILDETNLDFSDINYLACDVGPGSFTGIRIGVATIKAISEIKNLPICPVSSLEALSQIIREPKELIVSLIDARNDQAYCGIFNSDYSLHTEFFADSISNIIKILKKENKSISFVGDASLLHKNVLEESFTNSSFVDNTTLTSYLVGISSKIKISHSIVCTSDELIPLYLRKSSAERLLGIKNGKN